MQTLSDNFGEARTQATKPTNRHDFVSESTQAPFRLWASWKDSRPMGWGIADSRD